MPFSFFNKYSISPTPITREEKIEAAQARIKQFLRDTCEHLKPRNGDSPRFLIVKQAEVNLDKMKQGDTDDKEFQTLYSGIMNIGSVAYATHPLIYTRTSILKFLYDHFRGFYLDSLREESRLYSSFEIVEEDCVENDNNDTPFTGGSSIGDSLTHGSCG